jgi:coenzyme F420-reducing hydrogenase alpha subunit
MSNVGELGERDATAPAPPRSHDPAGDELQVGLGDLQALGRLGDRVRDEVGRRADHGRAAEHGGAARVRAEALRDEIRVAVDDLDGVHRHLERIGEHLRERRAHPLTQ